MDDALKVLLENISKSLVGAVTTTQESNEFNIFEVLGITNREVYICRFLGELLDPNGRHGEGARFLESFIETVLGEDAKKELLADATVELEEVIKDNRRVDIAIHIGEKVYPIEVKIWAGDQDAQLNDYYSYYNDNGFSCEKIYYLTPDRHEPSLTSTKGLDATKIVGRSFKKEIMEWIEAIRKMLEPDIKDNNALSIYVLINQFKGAIETMCAEYKKEEIIMEHIFQKEDDIGTCLAALEIIRHKDTIIEEFQYRYLDRTLEKHFEKNSNIYEINRLDQNSDERKEDPSRKYKIVKNNKVIAFICIKENLYLKLNKGYEIKEKDKSYKPDTDKILWRYLCTNKIKKINLKNPTCKLSFDDKIILNVDDLEKIVESNKGN